MQRLCRAALLGACVLGVLIRSRPAGCESTTVPAATTTTGTTLPGGGERLTGEQLVLRDSPGKAEKRGLLVRSVDTTLSLGGGPGSDNDPTLYGGSLRVVSAAGDGFDTLYPLPSAGWHPIEPRAPGRGWKFTRGNPVRLALLKGGRLRIVGKSALLGHTLGSNPDPVDVVLTLGTRQYCLRFGGNVSFSAGKSFLAMAAPTPAACPGFIPSDR